MHEIIWLSSLIPYIDYINTFLTYHELITLHLYSTCTPQSLFDLINSTYIFRISKQNQTDSFFRLKTLVNCNLLFIGRRKEKIRRQLTWFTVFSSSRAAVTASKGEDHSSLVGFATGCKTIRPPRLFWYFINFSACSRSSSEDFLKKLWNPGRATSSRSK